MCISCGLQYKETTPHDREIIPFKRSHYHAIHVPLSVTHLGQRG